MLTAAPVREEGGAVSDALKAKYEKVKATTYNPGTPAEGQKDGMLRGLTSAIAIAMVEEERADLATRDEAPADDDPIYTGETPSGTAALYRDLENGIRPLLASAKEASAEAGELVNDLLNLKEQFERIVAKPSNEQPAYKSGVRPFGTGDLLHFIKTLTSAANALRAQPQAREEAQTVPGGVIVAYERNHYRFHPYSPRSEQFRRGIKGRWQKMTEYGGWENSPAPSIATPPAPEAEKLREEALGPFAAMARVIEARDRMALGKTRSDNEVIASVSWEGGLGVLTMGHLRDALTLAPNAKGWGGIYRRSEALAALQQEGR
ncbi:hypothetical protein [Brevundimonas bullata]|uniref:hypothetical protein n=1 Tax=Brevundimonas bullata TaxID=13160 RepID=UPI003D9A3C76